ncbi:MAG: ribosome rescue protein RqcH [Candidatus Nezhaarchaeota archaeon]|nr:ribosome rescue protein RqcH [Candidatus Nezhaarchaeota archaeon]
MLDKLKPKRSLSALDVRALVKEIADRVVNGTVINVYLINDIFMLRVRCADGVARLLTVKLPRWLTISKYDMDKPALPTAFCKQLRKHLNGARLTAVEQVGFDRILRLRAEREGVLYELIVELVREGNIVLCDEHSTILGAYRKAEYKDRVVEGGAKYQPPPNLVAEAGWNLIADSLSGLKKPNAFYLALALVGSPELAYEVLTRSGVSPDQDAEASRWRILEKAKELLSSLERTKPQIVYWEGKPFSVLPVEFEVYRNLEKGFYSSFHEAVADFFLDDLKEALLGVEDIKQEEERLKASIEEAKGRLHDLARRAEGLEKAIKFMEANGEAFEELLGEVARRWPQVLRGADKLEAQGVRVLRVNAEERIINVDVNGVEISLNPFQGLMSNMSSLYDELKALRRKLSSGVKALEELNKNLLELAEKKKRAQEEAKRRIRIRREAKHWYERFLWFRSSDGFIVVAGRDASQNEVLVKRYLEDDDVFLHADITGAPVVVVKCGGGEASQTAIQEAAQFAASYSKAWKVGLGSVDVYWVYGRQVSKTPQSGEYLPKGSFMVRGLRSYLRGVELKVAVGLKVEEGREFYVVSGPPQALKGWAEFYVTLVPGDGDRGRTAVRIAKIFNERLRSLGFGDSYIRADDVLKFLPIGGLKIAGRSDISPPGGL